MRISHFLLLAILLVACQQALPTPAPALTAVPPTTVAIVTATPTHQPPPIAMADNTATPSPTAVPTKTATATATATHTPLPTGTPSPTATSPVLPAPAQTLAPDVWAGIGTPMPPNSAVISPENIAQITQLGHWGKGRILTAAYTPDGTQLIALTAEGVYWYDAATAEQTAVQRYNRPLVNMALSPDGQLLALAYETSGGGPSYVEVRRTADNELVTTLLAVPQWMRFTADGKNLLAAAWQNQRLNMWDIATGTVKRTMDFTELRGLDYEPANNILATWDEDLFQFWSIEETGLVALGEFAMPAGYEWGHEFTLSPDGELLALAKDYTAGQITVFRRTDGEILYTLDTTERKRLSKLPTLSGPGRLGISSLSFSPDSHLLALATGKLEVTIWRTADGELLQNLQDVGDQVYFAPDGATIAAGRDTLAQWRVADASFVNILNQHIGATFALAFVPNQPYLAIGSGDGFVYIRHLQNGGLVTSLRASRDNNASLSSPLVADLDFSADGQTLVTAADDAVRVWNMSDYSFTTLAPRPRGDIGASAVAISPDGRYVAMSQFDGPTFIWDLNQPLQEEEDVIWYGCHSAQDLFFTPATHAWFMCNVWMYQPVIEIWINSLEVGQEIKHDQLDSFSSLGVSSDGNMFAVGLGQTGHIMIGKFVAEQYEFVFETTTLPLEESDYLNSVIFSPDNQLIIALAHSQAFVLATDTGELIHTWSFDGWNHGSPRSLAISPDGRWLAIGTNEGIVQLWGIPQ